MKFTVAILFTLLTITAAMPTPQMKGASGSKDTSFGSGIGSGTGGAASIPQSGINGSGNVANGNISKGAAEAAASAKQAEADSQMYEANKKQAEDAAAAAKKQQQDMLDIIKDVNKKIAEQNQAEIDTLRGIVRGI